MNGCWYPEGSRRPVFVASGSASRPGSLSFLPEQPHEIHLSGPQVFSGKRSCLALGRRLSPPLEPHLVPPALSLWPLGNQEALSLGEREREDRSLLPWLRAPPLPPTPPPALRSALYN